jgi:hypothetical protein
VNPRWEQLETFCTHVGNADRCGTSVGEIFVRPYDAEAGLLHQRIWFFMLLFLIARTSTAGIRIAKPDSGVIEAKVEQLITPLGASAFCHRQSGSDSVCLGAEFAGSASLL